MTRKSPAEKKGTLKWLDLLLLIIQILIFADKEIKLDHKLLLAQISCKRHLVMASEARRACQRRPGRCDNEYRRLRYQHLQKESA